MKTIHTSKAPAAIGPYSQAKKANGFIFLSGQLGIDPSTGKMISDDIKDQTEQAIRNIDAILAEMKLTAKNVIKTTCFLTDMEYFPIFNEAYTKYFTENPARSCIAVKTLPAGGLCEIEVIAVEKE